MRHHSYVPAFESGQCFVDVKPLTIRASLKSLSLRLYDEEQKMLVGWNGLKRYQTQNVEVEAINS